MTKRLTLQQVFDNAVRGVHAQGKPAYGVGEDRCHYRLHSATGTLKCAIGWSIPDDLYDPHMEGGGMRALTMSFPEVAKLLPEDTAVLADLQMNHDLAAVTSKASFMEDFLGRCWAFAAKHKLTWPEDVPVPD